VARVLLLEDGTVCDVFDVVAIDGALIKARSPFLFEIGEELRLRIEGDGRVREVAARVRGHVGASDDKITELELTERGETGQLVTR
jgi:hypothetical protein